MRSKIDYEEINRLINLLEENNLSHFELEIEGFKIKISRNVPHPSLSTVLSPSQPAVAIRPDAAASAPLPADLTPETLTQEKKNNLHYVISPMVGTFYLAPNPNSPPFVEVGDEIKKNQTICIIEAMKLMNEIEADVDGVLKEICVENGKPIEFGQKLFAIQKFS